MGDTFPIMSLPSSVGHHPMGTLAWRPRQASMPPSRCSREPKPPPTFSGLHAGSKRVRTSGVYGRALRSGFALLAPRSPAPRRPTCLGFHSLHIFWVETGAKLGSAWRCHILTSLIGMTLD